MREKLPAIQEMTTEEKKITEQYSIIKEGAMKYITNSRGKIVSEGYHDFKVIRHGELLALIGQTGAMQRLLKMPTSEEGFFEESPAEFHELRFNNELGLLIAKEGAMQFILDMNTGEKISEGYHSFFEKNGKLYGRMGARMEEIDTPIQRSIDETRQITDASGEPKNIDENKEDLIR